MAVENPTILRQATKLGLIKAFMDSIIAKALDNRLLLGEPIKNPFLDYEEDDQELDEPKAKRQLFALDWKSEDLSLTTLDLQFYDKSKSTEDDEEEKVSGELEKMSSKVMKLEKECLEMRKQDSKRLFKGNEERKKQTFGRK